MQTTSYTKNFNQLLLILCAVLAFGALAIDMYLPALPSMAVDLASNTAQMQLTLSVFFAGFCIGMLIYGPLSDHLGRRKLLLSGILLFALTSAACMLAQNAYQLITLRGIQALGCGACVVMARAASRDIFPSDQLPRMMSKMSLITMIAPLSAPSLGALCLYLAGWRSIFAALAVFAMAAFVVVYQYVPETLEKNHDSSMSVGYILKTYGGILASKNDMALMFSMACAMSGMFAFISGAPFVYTQLLGFTEFQFSVLFGSNIVLMLAVTTANLHLLKRFEARTLMVWQAGVLLIAGTALIVFAFLDKLLLIVPLVILYVSHVNAISSNGMACLLRRHPPHQAGAVSALAVSLQFGLASLSTSLVAQFSHTPAIAMTAVMAGFSLISFLCAWSQKGV